MRSVITETMVGVSTKRLQYIHMQKHSNPTARPNDRNYIFGSCISVNYEKQLSNKCRIIYYYFYSIFIILAGSIRDAFFICQHSVPKEIQLTTSNAIRKTFMLNGAFITRALVY